MKSTPHIALRTETCELQLKSRRILVTLKYMIQQNTSSLLLNKLKLADKVSRVNQSNPSHKIPALIIAWRRLGEGRNEMIFPRQYPCFAIPLYIQLQSTNLFDPMESSLISYEMEDSIGKKNEFLELVHFKYSHDIPFYTDGSIIRNNEYTGAAVFCPDLQLMEGYSLPFKCSIFTAEMFAIRQALLIVKRNQIKNTVIFSDSLSALRAINFTGWSTKESWLVNNIRQLVFDINTYGGTVKFVWIPSHSNIHGNDVADKIAKNATISGERLYKIAISWQDMYAYVKQEYITECKHLLLNDQRYTNYYVRNLERVLTKPWFQSNSYSRTEISLLIRLRTNHALTPHRLYLMGLRESDNCSCGGVSGDLNHIIFSCRLYNDERIFFEDQIRKCGFQYPINVAHLVNCPSPCLAKALSRFITRTKMKL